MPLVTGEQSTEDPRREAPISRRTMVRAALGSWLTAVNGFPAAQAFAQTESATPSAARTPGPRSGLELPSGIRVARDAVPASGAPKRGGEVRLVRPGGSQANFNPSAFQQDPQIPLSYLEPLVRPDPATMRPTSWLAERWEWRADGLELVFLLRDGVLWHNELPLTAADAAFSFEVYRSDTESAVRGLFALVESLDAVSERELRVRFTARDANWLFNVASLPIVSRDQYGEFWQGMPALGQTLSGFDWSRSLPVGTGPWRITEWDADEVTFTRFDRYWGQRAVARPAPGRGDRRTARQAGSVARWRFAVALACALS